MVLDKQIFNELKELMGEGLTSLVERYITLSQEYIVKIQQGVQEGNATQVEEAAHPLKSSSLQLSAVSLYEIAKVVENEAATHHQITPRLRDYARQLPEAMQASAAALRAALAA